MKNHTPGPWTCTPGRHSDAEYLVYDKDGNFLTDGDLEHEANASLIAAAPELLECLDMMVGCMNARRRAGETWGVNETNAFHAACTAIAKVRGE